LTVALVATVTAAIAGAATNSADRPPLLTYAVAPMYAGSGSWISLGMCATDLQGKTFRLSDPRTDVGPSWSPDGRSIAFLGPADPPAQDHFGDLFVTDARGRHQHNLTQNGGRGSTREIFGWSPDASELGANWSGYFTDVFIAKTDGTGARALAEAPYGESVVGESWAPDGRQILLSRSLFAYPVPAISVINADGTNERKLIDGADRAAWSPEGQRFAYVSFTDTSASGLGVAQADGSNAHLLLQGWASSGGLPGRPTAAGSLTSHRPTGSRAAWE
jgi:Tol biopolymer transport system component